MKIRKKICTFLCLLNSLTLPVVVISCSNNESKQPITKEAEIKNKEKTNETKNGKKEKEPNKTTNSSNIGKQNSVINDDEKQKTKDKLKEKDNSEELKKDQSATIQIDKEEKTSKNDFDFSDLEDIPNNFEISSKHYKTFDAFSFLERVKNTPNEISNQMIFDQKITEKYFINVLEISSIKVNNETGILSNIKLKFSSKSNNNNFIEKTFSLSGFKTKTKEINPKSDFVSKQDEEHYEIYKNIFPSLLGIMLIKNKNTDVETKFNEIEKQDSEYSISDIRNHGINDKDDLFFDRSLRFNPSMPNNFIKINEIDETKYTYKINGVKANDNEGTLELEVLVSDMDETNSGLPDVTKTLKFNNLRKHNTNKKGIYFNIETETFSSKIKENNKISSKLKEIYDDNSQIDSKTSIKNNFNEFEIGLLRKFIFNSLQMIITDRTYITKENGILLNNIKATNSNDAIFPFITKYNESILSDFEIFLEPIDGQNSPLILIVEANLSINSYESSSFIDMTDLSSLGPTLSFKATRTLFKSKFYKS
ncbi:LppA-related lipoprotein [Mycoplasmopsis canis]|uniref:LppA-related lipoprotein n=1 Tax=Mycoplasmopsis canis TaxID=29555 RepID=UPI000B0178FC|nr:hypothetical protein [Mycoplasmopsis canis]